MGMHGMGRMMRFNSENTPRTEITKELVLRIWRYYRPYLFQLLLMIIALIVTSGLSLIPPTLTKNIIDVALPQADMPLLGRLTLMSFAAALGLGLISVGQNYLNTWVSKHIIFDIKNHMYNHLQHMSMRFFTETKTGEILSRINNDVNGIERVFSGTILSILQNLFTLCLTIGFLFYQNWKLAIISILIPPIFITPTKSVGKARWRIATQTQEKLAELTNIQQESLNAGGAMLVKLNTREEDQFRRFQDLNRQIIGLQIRESIVGRWFMMFVQAFTNLGPNLIYFVGGYLFIRGELSIGTIVAFVALLPRLFGPVAQLSNIHIDISRSMALFERIFEYLDLEHEITDVPDAEDLPPIEGKMSLIM